MVALKSLVVGLMLVVAVTAVSNVPCSLFELDETSTLGLSLEGAITFDPALDTPNGEIFVKYCVLSLQEGRNFSSAFYTPETNPTGGPRALFTSDWKKLVITVTTNSARDEFRFKINPSAFLKTDRFTPGLSDIVFSSGEQYFDNAAINPLHASVKNLAPGYLFECEFGMKYVHLDLIGTGWRLADAAPGVNEVCGAGAHGLPAQGGREVNGAKVTVSLRAACGTIVYGGCDNAASHDNYLGEYRLPLVRWINVDPEQEASGEHPATASVEYEITGVSWNIPVL